MSVPRQQQAQNQRRDPEHEQVLRQVLAYRDVLHSWRPAEQDLGVDHHHGRRPEDRNGDEDDGHAPSQVVTDGVLSNCRVHPHGHRSQQRHGHGHEAELQGHRNARHNEGTPDRLTRKQAATEVAAGQVPQPPGVLDVDRHVQSQHLLQPRPGFLRGPRRRPPPRPLRHQYVHRVARNETYGGEDDDGDDQ